MGVDHNPGYLSVTMLFLFYIGGVNPEVKAMADSPGCVNDTTQGVACQ